MKLKNRTRNLITVILSVLCAVLLAVGISFMLPKSKKVAHAAAPSITVEMSSFQARREESTGGPAGVRTFLTSADASTYALVNSGMYGVSYTTGATSIDVWETSLNIDGHMRAFIFEIKLTIPARTAYDVKLEFDMSTLRGGTAGLSNGVSCYSELLLANDDDGQDIAAVVNDETVDNIVFSIDTQGHPFEETCEESGDITVLYKNEKSVEKEISRKFVYCVAQESVASAQHKFVANLTLTSGTVVKEYAYAPVTNAEGATSASDTYTGEEIEFETFYNLNYLEPTGTIIGKDPNGNALATAIQISDFDTTTGKFKPTLAGTYTVTFGIKPSAATDGVEWESNITDPPTLTFTVKRKPIAVPTNTPENYTYSGVAQAISYSHDYLKYLKVTPADTSITFASSTATSGTFNGVKNAGSYTMTFALNDVNYEWNNADATGNKTITVKMKPKTLEFDFKINGSTDFSSLTTNSTGNLTAAYKTTGSPVNSEVPVLKFSYEFGGVRKEIGTDEIANLTKDITTLEGTSNTFSAGTYKLIMELTTADTVNKNYAVGDSKEMTFTVGAGAADLSALKVQYTKTSTGATQAEIPSGGLTYSYDSDTKTAEEYKFFLDFSALSYLTADSYTYRYAGTTSVVNGFTNAGTAKIEVKIKLADSSDVNHSLPATFATANTPFDSYTNNGDGTATLTFTVVIDKALTTLTGEDIPLQYWFAGETAKQNYDKDNPPECKDGIPAYIEWTGVKPHGVANVVFDSTPDMQVSAGDYKIDATVTLDDNYKTASGGNTLRVQIPWTLSKQIIKLDWTDKQIDKAGLTPHFVKNLNNLTDGQKQVIKYVYYLDIGGSPDSVALTEAEFDALCTNDRYTDPKWLWVEAVIDTTVTGHEKFELENDPVKNPVRFKLGRNMTMVEATKSPEWDKLVYGGNIDKPTAFTFTDKSTNLPWNSIFYELHVYKDGVDLGLFDTFDFTTADAAKDYAVQVVMKPAAINADGDDIYAIDIGKTIPFEIKPKAIALPTLGDMVFTGGDQSIKDYLGGETWNVYGPAGKNVIALGGDFEGIRNVGVSDYVATLTLTDSNYCWDYGTGATGTAYAVSFKVGAGYSVDGTAQQANYKWNIAPLVIDTTNMWSKGKNGATLNLPQNVKDLISAGSLELGYKYYENGQFVENPEIKGNKQFKVEAVFGGDDAVRNVQFKTGDTTIGNTSPAINYTVPQSGMQAFGGKVLSFLKNYWWWILIALAILILLIILIVVIAKRRKNKEEREEKKRQKEEEKERKEEEKRRKEEEREEEKRRREEEREREKAEREAERERQKAELEAEKERQKAELELAKAKQEAELAKMKAEAAAAAGLGAAGMAVAAQPQQAPAQQPVQQVIDNTNNELLKEMREQTAELRAENRALQQQKQQQPAPQPQPQYVQQPATDPNALARIEAELAAMRAENRANQHNNSMSMAQPMMMPMQQPMMQMPMQMPMMQQPSYGPAPSYGGNGGGDINQEIRARLAEERARTAEDRLFRTTEQRAILAEDRLARSGNNNSMPMMQQPMYMQAPVQMQQPQPQPQVQPVYLPAPQAQAQPANGTNADTFGAVLASMFKSLTDNNVKPEKKPVQEVTQVIEAESQPTAANVPTVYPPDAVVTTTTTIDTTKNKAQPRAVRSDDGRLFDIDGFYDTFEGNK